MIFSWIFGCNCVFIIFFFCDDKNFVLVCNYISINNCVFVMKVNIFYISGDMIYIMNG